MDHESQLISDLNGDDDLGCAIRGHIHVENGLDKFISKRLANVSHLKRADLDYFQKVHVALALGLPEILASPLKYIGNLRNKFAHNLGRNIGKQEAKNFYESFASEERDYIQQVIARVNSKNPGNEKKFKSLPPKEQFALCAISLEASLFVLNGKVR
jgi:hypothetical protein